jgi:hypothetical protein
MSLGHIGKKSFYTELYRFVKRLLKQTKDKKSLGIKEKGVGSAFWAFSPLEV